VLVDHNAVRTGDQAVAAPTDPRALCMGRPLESRDGRGLRSLIFEVPPNVTPSHAELRSRIGRAVRIVEIDRRERAARSQKSLRLCGMRQGVDHG
jgi:hypothetical protein